MSCHDTFFNIFVDTNDVDQVIAAEGENSAAQALRNASEVNCSFNEQLLHWVNAKYWEEDNHQGIYMIVYNIESNIKVADFKLSLRRWSRAILRQCSSGISRYKIQLWENSKPIILSGWFIFHSSLSKLFILPTDPERDLAREELDDNISRSSWSAHLLHIQITHGWQMWTRS